MDGQPEQHVTPAAYGRGFLSAEPLTLNVREARRGVQVGAHEVVLELRGLVPRVQQDFALRERGGKGTVVHRTSMMRLCRTNPRAAPYPEISALRSRHARASRGKRCRASARASARDSRARARGTPVRRCDRGPGARATGCGTPPACAHPRRRPSAPCRWCPAPTRTAPLTRPPSVTPPLPT